MILLNLILNLMNRKNKNKNLIYFSKIIIHYCNNKIKKVNKI